MAENTNSGSINPEINTFTSNVSYCFVKLRQRPKAIKVDSQFVNKCDLHLKIIFLIRAQLKSEYLDKPLLMILKS